MTKFSEHTDWYSKQFKRPQFDKFYYLEKKDVNNNVSNIIINSFLKICILLFHIWVLTVYAIQTCMNISEPEY